MAHPQFLMGHHGTDPVLFFFSLQEARPGRSKVFSPGPPTLSACSLGGTTIAIVLQYSVPGGPHVKIPKRRRQL